MCLYMYVYIITYVCIYTYVCIVFIQTEVQEFISYKRYLTRHFYEPILHFTYAFIYFTASTEPLH